MLSLITDIFKVKTCLAIWINKNLEVYGVVMKRSSKKFHVLNHCCSKDREKTFELKVAEVYKELKGDTLERILVCGYGKRTQISIDVPSLALAEVKNYLTFELPNILPYAPERLAYSFRPLKMTGKKVERVLLTVMPEEILRDAINRMNSQKDKYDSITHPYSIINELYPGHKLYIESINEAFYVDLSLENDFRLCQLPAEQEAIDRLIKERDEVFGKYRNNFKADYVEYLPCVVMASFGLSSHFSIEKTGANLIPKENRPMRFRAFRQIAFTLIAVFAALIAVYCIRDTINDYNTLQVLNSEIGKLDSYQRHLDKAYAKASDIDKPIQQIYSAVPGDIDEMDFLSFISEKIPDSVWVTNFTSMSNSVNMTFQSKVAMDSFISQLYNSHTYTLQNSQKSSSTVDNSQTINTNFIQSSLNNAGNNNPAPSNAQGNQ